MRYAVLFLLLTACLVPKKKLDAALAEQAADKVGCDNALMEKDHAIADKDAALADKDASLADANKQLTALNLAVKDLREELAHKQSLLDEAESANDKILKDRGALRGEVQKMKEAMADLDERRAAAEKVVSTYKDLLARFKTLIDAGTLQVKIVDGRMVVVLKTDILFSSGSAELSKPGKEALAQVAQVLAGFDRKFQIEGHTDNVPIHSDKYASNWYLASARAIGVVDHLVASGMDPKRVSAASYGEFVPVASNDTAEGKAQNRRIEIVIQPDLSQLPGFDELKAIH